MKKKKTWYGISNDRGGYLFCEDKDRMWRFLRDSWHYWDDRNVRVVHPDFKHEHFMEFNSYIEED